jgi:hypothetical protein
VLLVVAAASVFGVFMLLLRFSQVQPAVFWALVLAWE